MGKAREESALVKACAKAYGVSDRAVRNWRDAKDTRWIEFIAERARATTTPRHQGQRADKPIESKEELGHGLDFEIIRLKRECVDLSRRMNQAKENEDLEAEMSIRKMLLSSRESLRRLEKENPDIQRESGEMISKAEFEEAFIGYVSSVSAVLENLSERIISMIPEIRDESRERVRNEVQEVRRTAAAFKIGILKEA